MNDSYFLDREFSNINTLEPGEYESCKFINCNFAECDLSKFEFINCQFINCNLSLIITYKTHFRDVHFATCKMLGIRFNDSQNVGLSISFNNCLLNHSTFYNLKIRKTDFVNCQMHECDFSETDLRESIFNNCDLFNTQFDRSNLESCDFRNSYNYRIDPETNKIRNAKFSLLGVKGLLTKYQIHIE